MKKILLLITFLMPVSAMAQQTLEYENTSLPNDLQKAKDICESHRHLSNELLLSNPPQPSYYYDSGFSELCRHIDDRVFSYNNRKEIKDKKDINFLNDVLSNSNK